MEAKNQETLNNQNSVGNSLIEFLLITTKYKWFLLWFILAPTIIATSYALFSPKWYKASASVLPAEKTDFLGAMGGLSSLVKGFSPTKGLAALTGTSEIDRYIAILKSGTITVDVIEKFNLRKEYDLEDTYYEDVVKQFLENVEIEVQDEGNLVVSVYDKSPTKASRIANYMIEKLNALNTELSTTNARANREFVEKRYLESVKEISSLENEMQEFQQKYGVIAVPEQLEASYKTMSDIYAEMVQKEVAVSVLKRIYGENNPLVVQPQIEMEELRSKIAKINNGTETKSGDVNLLIPFKKAPSLANKYLKIYKDLEIQYKILEFVQPMYEQAKVEEIRETPSVLVLDKASPPEKKSKPKASLYLIISLITSSFVGMLIIFSLEGINKLKNMFPEKHAHLMKSFAIRKKQE